MPRSLPTLALLALLAACGERYSPDTYATRAVQQANKVEQGIVIGARRVQITAEGTTGAAAGAAAGGVIGAQTPGGGIGAALGGVGGALVGGLIGRAAEGAAVDTPAYEYVVRTEKAELLSVTQVDRTPLAVGQRVLVITGNQARIVPDYTSAPPVPPAAATAGQPPPASQPPTPPAAATIQPASIPAVPPPPVVPPPPPPPEAPSSLRHAAEDAAIAQLPAIAQPAARAAAAEDIR